MQEKLAFASRLHSGMICGRCIAWQLDTKVLAYMKARGMKKMLEVDFERRVDRTFKRVLTDGGIVARQTCRDLAGEARGGRWNSAKLQNAD